MPDQARMTKIKIPAFAGVTGRKKMREYSEGEKAYWEQEADRAVIELRAKYPTMYYWGKLSMMRYPDKNSNPKGIFDIREGNAKFEIAKYLMSKGISVQELLQTVDNSIKGSAQKQ